MLCIRSVTTIVFFLICNVANAQNGGDHIIGTWLTPGKEPAKIQIYKSGEHFMGKIIWLKTPDNNGKPKLDNNNPDKTKINNPVIGLLILTGFKFSGDGKWEGGKIYDPESGKTYSSNLTLQDKNTLKVRGYVGISLFGRTEVWSRTN